MSSRPQSQQQTSHKNSTRKRITKDEKICQLKSELKVSKAENSRLRKEIERLQQGNISGNAAATSAPPEQAPNEEQKKFREAMRAFKKVTVGQEICIKTLRNKATQRQKGIKARDIKIRNLEQKVNSLETAGQKNGGDQNQQGKRIKELQLAYDGILQEKDELEELLDEKESKLESLQRQRNSLLTPSMHKRLNNHRETSDGESVGSASLQSISTAGDFDVARLKTELAKKSEKILALQMDLDLVKDELYDVKQQKKDTFSDPFGSRGSNPFYPQQSFPMGQQSGDDWTDADETDNESEFGDMQFGESFFKRDKDEENVDFW